MRLRHCSGSKSPATNAAFWQEKFAFNVSRDDRNVAALQSLGWRVAAVWECALRERSIDNLIYSVAGWLRSEAGSAQFPNQAFDNQRLEAGA